MDRGFLGVKFTYTGFDRHRPYFFFLDQQDHNDRNAQRVMLLGTPYPTR